MAENNTYVIRIVNETEKTGSAVGGAGGINAQASESGGTALGTTKSNGSGGGSNKAANALTKLFSAGTAVNVIKQAVAFDVSQVYVETGSREAQQRASALYSAGTTLAGVAAAGFVGGPAAAGVALLGTLISKATSLIFQMQAIENQSRLQDITRDLSAQRATVSGSRYMNAGEF